MDVLKPIELTRIEELKILQDVRLLNKHDLNPIYSKDNIFVQFEIGGEVRGAITCYLSLDNKDLSHSDKNYLIPLFVESMNILIGKQISIDESFTNLNIKLSSPKLSVNSREINTSLRAMTQKYELDIEGTNYIILIEYSLEAIN